MKTVLNDVTFVIPIRIDSIIRLENLLLTIDCLLSYFETNIVVIEASNYNNGILEQLVGRKVTYYFYEERDPVFHRTKILNRVSIAITTKWIGIWDADIVLHNYQIQDAICQLRTGLYDYAYPYDGRFLDTSMILRHHYLRYRDLTFLDQHQGMMQLLYTTADKKNAVGGAFLISTEKYRQSGLENEAFYGWGAEDGERFYRWKILNYREYRSSGPLYHLSHPRDHNGRVRSDYHEYQMMYEYDRIRNSTKIELSHEKR